MADIIDFTPRERVYQLSFTAPSPLKMTKIGGENISLEINRVDDSHGFGMAWVPASNRQSAKDKLTKMIEIIEWVEE